METANPLLGNPLFLAAVLLFLIILPLALRKNKKTELERAIERIEKQELRQAAIEEEALALQKAATPASTPSHPDGGPNQKVPEVSKEPPPAPRKKKKIVKEGVSISHNVETADPPKIDSGAVRDKKSSWDEDFHKSSKSQGGQAGDGNWVESEIPGLIIEPFLEDIDLSPKPQPKSKKSSQTKQKTKGVESSKSKPKAKTAAPADKNPEEIPTFKAAPKQESGFGADEFEDFPSEENLNARLKKSDSKTVEKKENPSLKTAKKDPETPETESKSVEIKAVVVSHKDIAKKKSGETKPKPFFLDLKYLISEEVKAEPDSLKKLSPQMVDRIVARLNDLQTRLIAQLAPLSQKHEPSDMRKERIQSPPPSVEGQAEEESAKGVTLEELDSFLFTANQRKK